MSDIDEDTEKLNKKLEFHAYLPLGSRLDPKKCQRKI